MSSWSSESQIRKVFQGSETETSDLLILSLASVCLPEGCGPLQIMIYLVTRVLKKFLWDFAGTFLVMEVRKQMHISLKPEAACKPQMWTSGLWCEIWGLNVLFRRQQSQGLPLLSYYRCCVVHIFIKHRLFKVLLLYSLQMPQIHSAY